MTQETTKTPGAENPTTLVGFRKGSVKKSAGGLVAIFEAFKKVWVNSGLLRGTRALSQLNQKKGFDCPSCAWPDPDDERSVLGEYCENGAKAVAEEATRKKIGASFFARHAIDELAALSDFELGKKGRIAEPLYLPAGSRHYQPIAWEQAFEKLAAHLNKLTSPNQAVFYTSGRTSNEAAFLYQLFAREFGTNNLPDCSNMCHESSGVALSESLGIGKGSVTLDDFYKTELIMILGQNPGTNHPRMLSALQKAKAMGATIIAINPLPETGLMAFKNPQQVKGLLGSGTALADIFLQVKINGDMPLLQAMACLLLAEEQKIPGSVFDHRFIENNTIGYNEYVRHLQSLDPGELIRQSGADPEQVNAAVSLLKNKTRIIACWAMGLTQHRNAVDTIKEIVNLLLLKGSIGKEGAGTCPVRGHSNVQGDRTMGIYEKPSPAFLDAMEQNFLFKPPQEPGYDTVESIKAMYNGSARVFMAMGGNFLSATPDTQFTAAALQKTDITVHVSTKLNRSHLVPGKEAMILPCLARSDRDLINGKEQLVSCENSMGVVQASRGVLKPVSDKLLSEPLIVCRLAKATLGRRSKVNWDYYARDYDAIRYDIERTIPGFGDYNQRVRKPGGFYLPNCNREGKFQTESGRAQFTSTSFNKTILQAGEILMMTIRSHDQFNTTIYGLDDRYRGIYNERRVVLMNEADIRELQLNEGELVDLFNYTDNRERVARKFIIVSYPILRGCCATYFPETNVLVPISSVAEKSNTPVSKAVIIRIKKAANND